MIQIRRELEMNHIKGIEVLKEKEANVEVVEVLVDVNEADLKVLAEVDMNVVEI